MWFEYNFDCFWLQIELESIYLFYNRYHQMSQTSVTRTWYRSRMGPLAIWYSLNYTCSHTSVVYLFFSIRDDDPVSMWQPLPTRLNIRKRRAREGRASDEIEHLPVPSRVTVRNRSSVSIIEHKDSMVTVKSQTFKPFTRKCMWKILQLLANIFGCRLIIQILGMVRRAPRWEG